MRVTLIFISKNRGERNFRETEGRGTDLEEAVVNIEPRIPEGLAHTAAL
jgi:hypothetical protein